MKKILYLKYAVFIVFLLTFLVPQVFAQTKLNFITADYSTRDDLDVLFANSTRVLNYLEGRDVEKPFMLALVTDTQKDILTGKGYRLTVIDPNAEIERYQLLYSPFENSTAALKGVGESVIPLSKHYILIKFAPGQFYSDENAKGDYFKIGFPEVVATPPLRTKEALSTPTPTPVKAASVPKETKKFSDIIYVIPGLLFLILLGLITFILIMKKRKKPPVLPVEDTINQFPPETGQLL